MRPAQARLLRLLVALNVRRFTSAIIARDGLAGAWLAAWGETAAWKTPLSGLNGGSL